MGKSAKVHKRVKKVKSSTSTANASTPTTSSSRTQVQAAKKRSNLKEKANKGSTPSDKGVLGGADYLTLLTAPPNRHRSDSLSTVIRYLDKLSSQPNVFQALSGSVLSISIYPNTIRSNLNYLAFPAMPSSSSPYLYATDSRDAYLLFPSQPGVTISAISDNRT
ncbi:hypothetical protein CPB84DRAFT_1845992 [Gymnopilus junonius]|uniref:Uncharacterized protein n=1 Tax=Gymnopilus junonius TaxID=109634 RepID=A0A9P5NTE1_GYMJU|nr:hypothetical protein CPB84DRAFT_1845992 [Gymnopilus junonius]